MYLENIQNRNYSLISPKQKSGNGQSIVHFPINDPIILKTRITRTLPQPIFLGFSLSSVVLNVKYFGLVHNGGMVLLCCAGDLAVLCGGRGVFLLLDNNKALVCGKCNETYPLLCDMSLMSNTLPTLADMTCLSANYN